MPGINEVSTTRLARSGCRLAITASAFFGFLYYDPPMAEMPTDRSQALPGDDALPVQPRGP